jgi:hypothetical protein
MISSGEAVTHCKAQLTKLSSAPSKCGAVRGPRGTVGLSCDSKTLDRCDSQTVIWHTYDKITHCKHIVTHEVTRILKTVRGSAKYFTRSNANHAAARQRSDLLRRGVAHGIAQTKSSECTLSKCKDFASACMMFLRRNFLDNLSALCSSNL